MKGHASHSLLFFYLSLSNFFTALGGGAVLAKGMTTFFSHPLLKGDSILAFLIGSTLSLVIIVFAKPSMKKTSGWLCSGAALCALMMWCVLVFAQPISGKMYFVFFLFLCIHFALIFIPRTLRAEVAAKYQQKIAWVELAYALGYTVGLFLWQRIDLWDLKEATCFAMISYIVAALLDFISTRGFALQNLVGDYVLNTTDRSIYSTTRLSRHTFLITTLLVAMTVGVQIVTQMITKLMLSTDPLVAFDIGTTIAPMLCGVFLFQISTPLSNNSFSSLSRSVIVWKKAASGINLFIIVIVCYGILLLGIVGMLFDKVAYFLFLSMIMFSALFYEIIALALLDHLGKMQEKGAVSRAFGFMAFVGAVSYWIFLHFGKSYTGCFVILLVSMLVSIVVMFWRFPCQNRSIETTPSTSL